jgi:hypothetical protein
MKKQLTKEDKVALKMIELVNDLTIDLEKVGEIISDTARNVSYNRIQIVAESAKENREL